jgi:hypothetical protein
VIANRYLAKYLAIVENARARNDVMKGEKHHIIPLALGGSNEDSNLVKVTYREHFVLHWLLTKCTSGEDRRKMNYAFWMMVRKGRSEVRTPSSWRYDRAKKANREASLGRKMKPEERLKLIERNRGNKHAAGHQNAKGFKHKDEFKQELSKKMKGKRIALGYRHTEETKKLISEMHKGNSYCKGYKHTEESKAKMRASRANPSLAMLEARRKHSEFMKGRATRKGKKNAVRTKDEIV